MPEFSMTIQAEAPIEDVWKLLHDPSFFPLWWAGMETIEPGSDGAFTMWPTGYPDFPMAQRLDASSTDHRVTISCLVSYLEFVWLLAPEGDTTHIDVQVRIPETEAHRLDGQRTIVADSLVNLAALAADG
ncbi:MAG TPA: SRPBCC family protein [Propionibacteriaceae bacterium]